MTGGPTADQQALVELAEQVLRGRTSNEQLAKTEISASRVDEQLWREAAGAGFVGIAVPEEHGGAGLGIEELLLLAEVQGRRLAPIPLVETAVAARVLAEHGAGDQCARWLPAVAAGDVVLAGAGAPGALQWDGSALTGRLDLVPQGLGSDALLLPASLADGGTGLFLIEAAHPGLRRDPVVLTDHSLAVDLQLDSVPAERLAPGAADRAVVLHRLALAAQLLGVADEGVREAAAYVSSREQFGRPLATFQAVTQQLGDAYCDVQAMRATLWQAAWAVEHDPSAGARSVDVAVWWATDAGQRVQHVVQHVHGGIGADTTYPVHRRLLWTLRASAALGGPSSALAALAPRVLPGRRSS
jgi:3-oxocholest-4-en-26-oyl-CoA dehydrogenase beta subunit